MPFWLALMELHSTGYRYATRDARAVRDLPLEWDGLIECIKEKRRAAPATNVIGTPEDLESALMRNPIFWDKVATHDIISFAMKEPTKVLAEVETQSLVQGEERLALESLLPATAAKEIAAMFFAFCAAEQLTLKDMTSEQIQVTAVYLSHLRTRPPTRVHLSERLDLLRKKPPYVPAEAVESPEVPHFVTVAAAGDAPKLQAPFVCQLCGDGFVNMQGLWKHSSKQHHSWAEHRKRLIFELQRRAAVPLQPMEKRRLAGNFYQDLLYSRPARGTLGVDQVCERQIVACIICAIKDWIDDFYPCYAWKEAPPQVIAACLEVDTIEDDSDDADAGGEACAPHKRPSGPALRDEDGFCYFGPVDQIDAILNVAHYRHVVPLAPLEELHASSVQHPTFPHMRWLMNTRRVPVLPPESVDEHPMSATDSAEGPRPACAGVGDAEAPCWLCHHCAAHLCQPRPRRPPQALVNWNWGGREHPTYQGLAMATKSLLGLGKLIARLVLLKPMDATDDCEKALVGNTILVAQPSPEIIAAELPPTEMEQAQYFNVVYASGAPEYQSTILSKKKALVVNRQEYLQCAQLRKERCPLFAHTPINVEQSGDRLPATGVPIGIQQGAIHMESVQYFSPTLAGPASEGTPLRASGLPHEGDDAEPTAEGDPCAEGDADAAHCRAPDSLIAEENANAEFLIGLDGTPDDDAIGKLAAARAKLNLAEDVAKRLRAATMRAHASAGDPDAAVDAAATEAALRADHKAVLVDLRSVARGMGERFAEEIENNITAAYRGSEPATLRVHTGAPLSLFDPAAWVACLTEFFYGDCAPNLERPTKISWRYLFKYLMNREELEYHLDTDIANFGKRYQANPDSRWNTPEFAALAADAVRKLQVLQSTKVFWQKTGHTFCKDMRIIANTTDKDFEDFQSNMQKAAIQNVPITTLIHQARAQGAVAVQKTLQHVLMHTATTAFSEGAKTTFRHMGQAMNERFGPFSTFFTTNFADTYSVLTVVLAQGAGAPLGRREGHLLQDSPDMPTSENMHKIVASRPMVRMSRTYRRLATAI